MQELGHDDFLKGSENQRKQQRQQQKKTRGLV